MVDKFKNISVVDRRWEISHGLKIYECLKQIRLYLSHFKRSGPVNLNFKIIVRRVPQALVPLYGTRQEKMPHLQQKER